MAFPQFSLLDITVKVIPPFNSIASKLMEYYMHPLILQNFSLLFLGEKRILMLTNRNTPDLFHIWHLAMTVQADDYSAAH